MSTYAKSSFNTEHYNLARPSYPDLFYKTLMEYHGGGKNNRELALDIGCGSGFVAFKLLEYFDKVIGTDPSLAMVDQCRNNSISKQGNIQFAQATAEQAPPETKENSVDLITGAECCHWVDHALFFKESFRILKPGGTLAYWFYKDPIFVNYPKANEIYTNYTYNSSMEINNDPFERYMGPYYQQPGHDFLRSLLKEIEVPTKYFEDIVRHEYDPVYQGADESSTSLYISKKINLPIFLDYVKSWSAYHSWMKEHGDKYDVAEAFVDELRTAMGWDDQFEFEVVWAMVYTFAKKRR